MKYSLLIFICVNSFFTSLYAQNLNKWQENRAGEWYAYWGWNEDRFTKSDIRFIGADYDFTLQNVKGVQRQYKFTINDYLNPLMVTIPQFNFRIGYFIRPDVDISLGLDHMKFVVKQGQEVGIVGTIQNTGTEHDGIYQEGDTKRITRDWMDFEHTDGLNWFQGAIRKHQRLFTWKFVSLSAFEGAEVGFLTPRTDATIFNKARHDKYRLAGYAVGMSGGLNATLWKYFFLQCELKGGFFHITGARTTNDPIDKARHHAFFGQAVAVFGGRWSLQTNP